MGDEELPATAPAFLRFLRGDVRGPRGMFALVLNPRNLYSSHIHGARPQRMLEACSLVGDCVREADVGILRIRHYTELFGHSGRFACCGPEDNSLAWAEALVDGREVAVE